MSRFKKISSFFKKNKPKIKRQIRSKYIFLYRKFEKRPLISIGVLLLMLLLLIIIGNFIRTPSQEEKEGKVIIKNVEVYNLGNNTQITVQGQIEKSGIITIVSQTSAIVKNINVKAGENVVAGKRLINLSSNYQGASAPSVQRQLAGIQYQNTKDTYDTQKDIISKQKDLTLKQDENADKLREISDDSIGRTEYLINLNENILSSIDSNIKSLEASNLGGVNNDTILSSKQIKSQVQSGLNQLKSSLDNTRYQSEDNNPPAEISNLTKDITLKQLELQEKALDLSLKTAGLQLQLANIQESFMFPASPINATVERIFVKEGQMVTPGTPLLVLHGDQKLQIITKIPFDLAQTISKNKTSSIELGEQNIELIPTHISIDVTDGNLASVLYDIPDTFQNLVANNSYAQITISLEKTLENNNSYYVPIDAVHSVIDGSIIYVTDGAKAKTIEVDLKNIRGSFAEVVSSNLGKYDSVITSRNVSDGDYISY